MWMTSSLTCAQNLVSLQLVAAHYSLLLPLMTDIRLRPRFETRASCSPRQLLAAIKFELDENQSEAAVHGAVFKTSAVLRIPASRRHYWSPELQVGVEPAADNTAVVRGLFGPRPAVWSMFIALYVFVAFSGTMGGMFGLSQLILGQNAFALWSVPAAVVAAILIYFVGRSGRALGSEQMHELRTFLDNTIAACS